MRVNTAGTNHQNWYCQSWTLASQTQYKHSTSAEYQAQNNRHGNRSKAGSRTGTAFSRRHRELSQTQSNARRTERTRETISSSLALPSEREEEPENRRERSENRRGEEEAETPLTPTVGKRRSEAPTLW